MFYIINWA
ncbi:5'-3' exonuclease family protein, partial [Chlamydia psittaci 06-1683]